MRRAFVMLVGMGLCVLAALANRGQSQEKEEDKYARANPPLEKLVKETLKIDQFTMRPINFGPPDIRDLKGVYFGEFRAKDKSWRLLRFATDYGDFLELQVDSEGQYKRVGKRAKCEKSGIAKDKVETLLKNVK